MYGVFSNFYKCDFFVDSVYWPTVEHFFQAQKFHDVNLENKIRNFLSPMDAAKEGRDRSNPLRSDWELVKDSIMRNAVLEKLNKTKMLGSYYYLLDKLNYSNIRKMIDIGLMVAMAQEKTC